MAHNQPPEGTSPGHAQPVPRDDSGTRVTPPAATWEPLAATTPPPGGPPTPPPGAAPSGPPPGAAPPGPPSGPPPGAPPSAPSSGRSGGGIPLPAFIGVAVVAVAALVFGIFMFLGKNSEADKKEDAQEELESTERELREKNDEIDAANEDIASLEDDVLFLTDELGVSEDVGFALAELVTTGRVAADSLFDCALAAVRVVVGAPDANPGQVEDLCLSAQDDYDIFVDALAQLE